MEEKKYIVFKLGEQKYGINLGYISGIEQEYHVISVPNAPGEIKGIINLRGEVIPVYSLRKRFGMDGRIDNKEKSLLVTKVADSVVGYEVDEVLMIEEMESDNILNMPAVASNEQTAFMEKVLRLKEDIVIVIDVEKVLSEDERKELNQLVEESK